MKKWLLAIVITLALSVYQRMTGPTHPKRVTVELNGERYTQKLPRSGVQQDEIVILKELPEDAIVQLHYRRFPSFPDKGCLYHDGFLLERQYLAGGVARTTCGG